MKATDLLLRQHKQVRAMLKRLASAKSNPAQILDQLCDAVAAHMAIEQEIFYPAVREVNEDLVLESYEEHSLTEIALKRLRATVPDSEAFRPRIEAVRTLIEHHLDEEEQQLIPAVERELDEERLMELGPIMKERYDEVLSMGFDGAVPKSLSHTSADKGRGHLEGVDGGVLHHAHTSHRRHARH